MSKSHCIAVIGTGVAALAHCRAILSLDAKLVCAGRDSVRVREFADKVGGFAAGSIEEALNYEYVNGVIVASDPRLNADLGFGCVARGKPVLLEKPATLTSHQCYRLAEAAHASGVTVAVGQLLRCADALVALKRLIDERTIGSIKWWLDERLDWRAECERQWWRGFPLHLLGFQGIHGIDLASWMLGRLEFTRAKWSDPAKPTGWIDEYAIDFTVGGIRAHINHSFRCRTGPRNRILVQGERGCAEVLDFRRLLLDGKEIMDAGEDALERALHEQDADFMKCISNIGRVPMCSISEARAPLRFIETALRSHAFEHSHTFSIDG